MRRRRRRPDAGLRPPLAVAPSGSSPGDADADGGRVPTGPTPTTAARRSRWSTKTWGAAERTRSTPRDLSFSVGEAVTFTLTAETEFHTFTVEDLDIDQSLEAGETTKFNFTFDKAGTFSLIFLAHPQMTGTITVQ